MLGTRTNGIVSEADGNNHNINSNINTRTNTWNPKRHRGRVPPGTNTARITATTAATSYKTTSRSVWMGRTLFVCALSGVAAVLGYLSFYYLRTAERALAETQFDSIGDRVLVEAQQIATGIKWSCSTLAELMGQTLPLVVEANNNWPFVALKGYETIATKLLQTVHDRGEVLAFAPWITTDQIPAFEAYAYDYFEHTKGFDVNNTLVSDFGRGIWGIGPNAQRVRVVNGTKPNSPYDAVFPVLQSQIGADPVLMFDLRAGDLRTKAIDPMISCSIERQKNSTASRSLQQQQQQCSSMTDMLDIVRFATRGPAIVIYDGVYPRRAAVDKDGNHNNTDQTQPQQLKGLIATLLLLDVTLDNVFPTEVSGVDCVISGVNHDNPTKSSPPQVFTYSIRNGKAVPMGEGDLHDISYNAFGKRTILTDPQLYATTSQIYSLAIYPTDAFYDDYRTNNPRVATILTVCTIVGTTLVFFAFDLIVRREFKVKEEMLQAKRSFMRFVSHEVRTPLNSVSMGLTVIVGELQAMVVAEEPETGEVPYKQSTRHVPPDTPTSNTTALSTANRQREKLEECIHLANDVQAQVSSATDVLNDLLNYDKIESGSLNLEYSFIDIWKLLERTAKEFSLPCVKKQIRLEVRFHITQHQQNPTDQDLSHNDVEAGCSTTTSIASVLESADQLPECARQLKLYGDSMRMTQVFRNLISNSIKFTPEGGSIRITAAWTEDKCEGNATATKSETFKVQEDRDTVYHAQPRSPLCVTVEDSGVGLSSEQLKSIFRPGVQYDKNTLQAGGGSGLGLFIAKGIVDQHNGKLTVTSEGLNKGCKSMITLPLCSICNGSGNQPPNDAVEEIADLARGNTTDCLRILVVDDAALNRKLLSRLLRGEGHKVDEADDGLCALNMVLKATDEGTPYQVLLLDFEMPIMSGPTTAKEIRARGMDVCIIGITGNMLPEDISYFCTQGANIVLPKPVKMGDLRSLLAKECGVADNTILGTA